MPAQPILLFLKSRKYNDPRIRLVGSGSPRVLLILLNKRIAGSKRILYRARFDADDVCYADRLQIQFDFMQSNPDHILCGSEADYMDMSGEYVFTLKVSRGMATKRYAILILQYVLFHTSPLSIKKRKSLLPVVMIIMLLLLKITCYG